MKLNQRHSPLLNQLSIENVYRYLTSKENLTLEEASVWVKMPVETILTDLGLGRIRATRDLGEWRFCRQNLNIYTYDYYSEEDQIFDKEREMQASDLLDEYFSGRYEFSYLDFEVSSNFKGQVLPDIDLYESRLLRANFEGADLSRADLSKAILQECDFSRANLQEASLVGADLRGCTFKTADLKNADIRDAILDGVVWDGVFIENTTFFCGISLTKAK